MSQTYLSNHSSAYLSIHLFIYLSFYLSFYLSTHTCNCHLRCQPRWRGAPPPFPEVLRIDLESTSDERSSRGVMILCRTAINEPYGNPCCAEFLTLCFPIHGVLFARLLSFLGQEGRTGPSPNKCPGTAKQTLRKVPQ